MSGHQQQHLRGGIVIVDDAASSSAIGATTTTTATRRGCSPPLPATTTTAAIDGNNKILQKRWVCDVCKVKWFLDFVEACAHEKNCSANGSNTGGQLLPPPSSSLIGHCEVIDIVEVTTALISADSNDGTAVEVQSNAAGQGLASIFRPQRGKTSTAKDPPKMTKKMGLASFSSVSHAKKKKKDKPSPGYVVPGVTQAEYEEHLVAEKEHLRRSTRTTTTKLAAIDEEMTEKSQTLTSTSNKRARLGKGEQRDGRSNEVAIDVDDDSTDEDANDECVVIDEVQTKPTKSDVFTKKKKGLLSKRQLAEHQAVEFFAKRKRAAAEERERQKKREELRLAKLKDSKVEQTLTTTADVGSDDGVNVVSTMNDASAVIKERNRKAEKPSGRSSEEIMQSSGGAREESNRDGVRKVTYPPAVRFPCPSHVVPTNDADESLDMEVEENSSSLRLLRDTLRYQHWKPNLSNSTTTRDDVTQHSRDNFSSSGDEMVRDDTFSLLSSVFDLSAKKKEHIQPSDNNKNQLWVDKYAITNIPDDILGANNKEASKKLLSFVEQWKVRRHKSVRAMGRVKSKGKRRGTKKRSHGYDSDDSFLDDEGGLENIFLITGPTGSGKSRIVHAVAEQSECVVIEINSSEQRSGAALKRAIQETTQSHSNLAISKKRQGLGKGDNDFFGNNANAGTAANEFDEDSDRWYESSDEESVQESHSLTIILIDEVDLLFDEDTAFWPALAQVSQKAKCPIVLTASSFPAEMNNLRYQYISLERPPPHECSIKMAEVANSEGMDFYQATVEDISKRLEMIAEICRCDMRKILNAMQLFRHAKSRQRKSNAMKDTNIFELQQMEPCTSLSTVVADRPSILSVEPRLVPKDRHSLVTISGKNFASSTTNLLIGGRVCSHFRILNDNKIIAVCPPCVIPEGVSENAIYEDEFAKNIDCLTCKFVDVVVRRACANGLILHSNSSLTGTCNSEYENWTIEYDIPLREDVWEVKTTREDFIRKMKARKLKQANMAKDNDDGLMPSDEEEFEDDTNHHKRNNLQHFECETSGTKCGTDIEDVDPQTLLESATADMDDIVEIFCNESLISSEACQSSFSEVNNLAEDLSRLSDAILLEDAFTNLAIPSLAGSVEGFGFDTLESLSCIDSISCADLLIDKLSKEKNKKPPSFETIFSSGLNESGFFFGNSDSYVTYPNRRRDRQLLCYSEQHSRGLGFLDNNTCSTEEIDEHSRSCLDDEDMSSFVQLQTRARFEDDILLRRHAPQTYLSPSLMLAQRLDTVSNHGLTGKSMPLLQSRQNGVASSALHFMHSVLMNGDSGYFGLRHDADDSVDHVWRRDSLLDLSLSLDYLPYLRAIAHHEVRVQRKFEDVMQDNCGRTRTRRCRSNVRRSYLDECAGVHDGMLDQESFNLAKTYMIME